jgi:hypothetical protein
MLRSNKNQHQTVQMETRTKGVSWLTVPREAFYVDFLGSLVPGLFTVIFGVAMVILTIATVYGSYFKVVSKDGPGVLNGLIATLILSGGSPYVLAVIAFVSSYIIGTAFFRQDPKKPDSYSAIEVWLNANELERQGLAVQCSAFAGGALQKFDIEKKLFNVFGFQVAYRYLSWKGLLKKFDTQFPYLYMRCYLAARGLHHLTGSIPWCPQMPETAKMRTKMFVNILKIRLGALAGHIGYDTIRNEAHVRLATSVWYAAKTLSRLGFICLLVLAYTFVLRRVSADPRALFLTTAFLLFVMSLCWLLKHHLRTSIHYMRVREVVYVLEAAHLADCLGRDFFTSDLETAQSIPDCRKCPRSNSVRTAALEKSADDARN